MIDKLTIDRVLLIVLDGVGVGAAPDAAEYGDTGENTPNTLAHTLEAVGGAALPTLQGLGLGNLLPLKGVPAVETPTALYGKLTPQSKGKDSVTGHWEMMGIITEHPFPTYPDGFPPEVIVPFEKAIGRAILGNCAASGTEIIRQLGEEHLRTGKPIVYTSADSVFQIAAHESVIPIEELYRMCETARRLLVEPHHVQRVIARPFEGNNAQSFRRTERRRDYPLTPPENLLDALSDAGVSTYGIGVVPELFTYRGFTHAERTQSNPCHFDAFKRALASESALIFANFEDFDMLYGHRNDPVGFANGLIEFDRMLSDIMTLLKPTDLLMLTADHGNDPTTPSTNHSREYVPLLIYSPALKHGGGFGTRATLADIAATLAACFNVKSPTGTPIDANVL